MIRARVVRHQCVPVTTPCRFYGSGVFAATLPLRIINNSSTTPIYYNPYTWPSDWTAVEIAAHLRSHLKPNAALKYPPLETMLKERNIPAIELAIRDWIEPPPRSASSDANAVTADAIDPQTWPPDWNTTDIKNLLSNHLINPNKVPNYALLITQRAAGEFEAIKDELWRYIPSPVIDPFNPYTWPRKPNARWNATDIENCLHNQVVPSPSLDFCKSLEAMLKDDKIDALSRELQDYIDEAEKTTKKLIKRNTTAKYYNPYTWPKNWEAADIKNHLNDFLIPNAQPLDYKSLETMLKGNKIATVTREIRDFIKPPPPTKTHTSAEFAKHYDPYSWPRNWNTTDIENLLSEHLKNPKEFTNYALLVTQLANGEFEALEKELKTYLKTGQSTEISFRAEAMKVFSTKFSKKFSFPKTIEAMEPVIKYLYKLFYPGNVVPSFYDALTQVFTRSDTYKDLSWFQKAKQDFARLGAAISDLPKLFNLSIVKPILRLTKLKLEYESVLYPMVLFAINATRKVQYTVHQFLVDEFLPPGQEKMSFRAFVAFLIKEKELESQRHIEYERAIESSSSPSSKTRSTRKMTSTETWLDP